MKHNYRFVFLTIFSLFFYFNITVPTSATTISNIEPYYKFAEQNNILPYSDACIWVYKRTNGKLYKRLPESVKLNASQSTKSLYF